MLNSYGQVFFSTQTWFAIILILVTFIDFYTGLYGLVAVVTANVTAYLLGLDREQIRQGYYGFNALLTGMGLGVYFQPGPLLFFIVVVAGILALFAAVALQGIIGKYGLPHLSLPFIITLWTLMLAGREFTTIGLNERGIYMLNDIYLLGGKPLLRIYEWWNSLAIPSVFRTYFLSLAAILFHYSILGGILMSIGLLLYSRIAFTLSLLGFFTAWLFYKIIGVQITETGYSYIGFNFILTAIAAGGFFIIPSRQSYLWVILLIPVVSLITISLAKALALFGLPVYSLPFNIVLLGFLYVLHFRVKPSPGLVNYFVQYNSPEKNFYAYTSYFERFGNQNIIPMHLPFHGEWVVTQAWDGALTHKGEWKYALDFEMTDDAGNTFRNGGDYPQDYYCYDKLVLAPADGTIEDVLDGIEDNIIGEKDLEHNWGNTIVIWHAEGLYSKLSHLKPASITVKPGERVKKGDVIARCGNSGNSPFPHLHFQLQATPFIGSKTLKYALNDLYIQRNEVKQLHMQAIPQLKDKVSNVVAHPSLRAAFFFVTGQKICWEVKDQPGQMITWLVSIDGYFNKLLVCEQSGAKAYFRVQEAIMYFTHFEGPRDSLLYQFFLSAHKISLGLEKKQVITDHIPVNKVFGSGALFLQDFLAPFYRFIRVDYTLHYPENINTALARDVMLEGSVIPRRGGKPIRTMQFRLVAGANGLQSFYFSDGKQVTEAVCVKDISC